MFNYENDELLETFISPASAARICGWNEKTVGQQCLKGKPKIKERIYILDM